MALLADEYGKRDIAKSYRMSDVEKKEERKSESVFFVQVAGDFYFFLGKKTFTSSPFILVMLVRTRRLIIPGSSVAESERGC